MSLPVSFSYYREKLYKYIKAPNSLDMTGMYNFKRPEDINSKLPTITEAFPPPPWNEASAKIRSFYESSLADQIEIANWCVKHCVPLSVVWGGDWRYVRARSFEKGKLPQNISELIWPPKNVASAGRANFKGEPVMYLSVRDETALAEIRHKDGHAVSSFYKITDPAGFKMIALGELTAIKRTGRGRFLQDHSDEFSKFLSACDYVEGNTMLLIDGFLADVMARHDVEYEVTAQIVKGLLSRRKEAGAVAYPSVQHLGGMNLAISTTEFWNKWGVTGVSSADYDGPGGGIYLPTARRNVLEIAESGELTWGDDESEVRKFLEFRVPFKENSSFPLR